LGRWGNGTPMLKVPDEAINLLFGAIDLDLEDERAALELVLNRAIDRGHFDEAMRVGVARWGLTIRYMERVRQELEQAPTILLAEQRRQVLARQRPWKRSTFAGARGAHLDRLLCADLWRFWWGNRLRPKLLGSRVCDWPSEQGV
jgi:hypothetical protein